MNFLYNIFGTEDITAIVIKLCLASVMYLAALVIVGIVTNYLPALFKKIFHREDATAQQAFVDSFSKPLAEAIKIVGIYFMLTNLPLNSNIAVPLKSLAFTVMRIIAILHISIAAQKFITNIPVIFKNHEDKMQGLDKTLIMFFTKIGKALVIVLTVVIIVEEFGYDITGLITGLGLGGLTFALAAQDIASNFMSGITILLDKPFSIGDWIAVNGMEGIVEELDFRSTKIRTFENALISVPNSQLGNSSVTNWTKMNYRKTNIVIGLVYSTTRETLQKVVTEIYDELSKFEEIKTDSLLVKFNEFSASSLDVKISYNSFPIPGSAHLALKEKVNLKIMEIVEKHDTDFAYNTVTVVNG